MARRKVFIIINPGAGGLVSDPLWERLGPLLQIGDVQWSLLLTQEAGEAVEAAKSAVADGYDAVVAVGGDGTVGATVGPLVGTPTALGIVPLGTANVAARELGLPLDDVEAACRVVAANRIREIDVGVCNGREFLVMCGVGLDARVAEQVDKVWKRYLGMWAYIGQFLQTIFLEPMRPFRITVDGKLFEREMWAAVICNGTQYTWRISLTPTARLDDGLLHVVMFHQPDALGLLNAVSMEWLAGGSASIPHTTSAAGREIRIETDPPIAWHSDGDVRGVTPVDLTLRPRSLRVIVPPEENGQ